MKVSIFDIANNRIIKHHMLDNKIVKMADIPLHYLTTIVNYLLTQNYPPYKISDNTNVLLGRLHNTFKHHPLQENCWIHSL